MNECMSDDDDDDDDDDDVVCWLCVFLLVRKRACSDASDALCFIGFPMTCMCIGFPPHA